MAHRAPLLLMRKAAEVAFGIVVFAVMTRTLSKEQFAVYTLVMGYVATARITSLTGLGNALSQAFARGHYGDFTRTLKLSSLGSLGGAAILSALGAWHLWGVDAVTGWCLVAAAVCFPLYSSTQFWRNAAVGSDRFFYLMVMDTVVALVRAVAILATLALAPDATALVVAASLAAPGIIHLIGTMIQKAALSGPQISEDETLSYGTKVSFYDLPTIIAKQSPQLALFYLISPEALAVYAVAMRIPALLEIVLGESTATLGPVFARQSKFTRSMGVFSHWLAVLYMALAVLVALLVVPHLLPILAGAEYSDAIVISQVLTIGIALGTLGRIKFRFLKSRMDSRTFLHLTTINGSTELLVTLALTAIFGLPGTVAAFLIKALASSLVTSAIVGKRYGDTA